MKEYTIDAKDRSLGRVASEAAAILRGKNSPNFKENAVPDVKLIVVNIDGIKITGQKLKQKEHVRYSGYPGGITRTVLEKSLKDKGMGYIFKKAVMGMLPKSKLQDKMIKNLIIK